MLKKNVLRAFPKIRLPTLSEVIFDGAVTPSYHPETGRLFVPNALTGVFTGTVTDDDRKNDRSEGKIGKRLFCAGRLPDER
ncbi:hypothetical protein DENIS_1590 [Desulfonema ishimotonii]|uniref:Uncharacterized protein n=1 Tax=Desulfonema ishimotonii TaxID=45657 RepID=A0A401FUJ6_9BACT|nr:hypothetical protein DENIS_1590 [Desulfonema ishimotonii]